MSLSSLKNTMNTIYNYYSVWDDTIRLLQVSKRIKIMLFHVKLHVILPSLQASKNSKKETTWDRQIMHCWFKPQQDNNKATCQEFFWMCWYTTFIYTPKETLNKHVQTQMKQKLSIQNKCIICKQTSSVQDFSVSVIHSQVEWRNPLCWFYVVK